MANILITGIAGFIGSNLCRFLLNKNHNIYGIDNFSTGSNKQINNVIPKINFTCGDINKKSDIDKLLINLNENKLDIIYHLACPTGVPNIQPMAYEILQTCTIGSFNIFDIAKQFDAEVICSSSSEIYGAPEVHPQDEAYTGNVSSVGPRSPYEEGKRILETIATTYYNLYNLNIKICRFFNIYGLYMSENDTRVIPNFIKLIQQEKEIIIYGDGNQTRTFLYIEDLIEALEFIRIKGKPGEIYNVGSDDSISVINLAELLFDLINKRYNIQYAPHFIDDHQNRMPSLQKLHSLGWKQKVSLKNGLIKTLGAYENNLNSNIR